MALSAVVRQGVVEKERKSEREKAESKYQCSRKRRVHDVASFFVYGCTQIYNKSRCIASIYVLFCRFIATATAETADYICAEGLPNCRTMMDRSAPLGWLARVETTTIIIITAFNGCKF